MCGFVGYVGSPEIPAERFERARDRLTHRGPDDAGRFHEALAGDTHVLLGHRRLAILDPSPAGRQPMTGARGDAHIVYNGEIYNFRELRADLEKRGHRFASQCDTEVLLAAYEEWGPSCVEHLNGMFAFAIYDAGQGAVFLARDRVGIKPLYLYHDGSRFAFASELTALTTLELAPPRIRAEAVAEYLAFGYLPADITPLVNYTKLPPGHAARYGIASRELRTWSYWKPLESYGAPELQASEEELAGRCEELLADAVARQMISDVPLGAFLSGGIDSSLVVALMRQASAEKVRTFTIGFTVPSWNEAPHAKAVAEHLGTEHHELIVSPKGLEAAMMRAASRYDEPFADSSCIPTTILAEMTRRHVTVALSGDGGDELFFGYGRHARARHYVRFRRMPAPLRAMIVALMRRSPSERTRRHGELLSSADVGEFYARLVGTRIAGLAPLPADGLVGDRAARAAHEALGAASWRKAVTAADLLLFLPDDLLTKVDRASMGVSLEVRVPLLDHRLVEFAARLPHRYKERGGRGKYLLRRVLAKHVPPVLWDRPKSGFGIPLAPWFRGELKPWVQEQLTESWDWTLGVIDRPIAQRMIADHLAGRADYARWIWAFIAWKLWAQRIGLLRS